MTLKEINKLGTETEQKDYSYSTKSMAENYILPSATFGTHNI